MWHILNILKLLLSLLSRVRTRDNYHDHNVRCNVRSQNVETVFRRLTQTCHWLSARWFDLILALTLGIIPAFVIHLRMFSSILITLYGSFCPLSFSILYAHIARNRHCLASDHIMSLAFAKFVAVAFRLLCDMTYCLPR